MGNKHICLPFASEAQYRNSVDYPTQYRQYLTGMLGQHPELFPKDMAQGFPLHDCYVSVKQDLIVRRIKLKATGAVFTLRPSLRHALYDCTYRCGRKSALSAAVGCPV